MGYCYRGRNLVCDRCGHAEGVRKRPCRFRVTSNGTNPLPWCKPPALCQSCWTDLGKGKIHDGCEAQAREAQHWDDVHTARLAAGEVMIRSAAGSWHEDCPEGHVLLTGTDGHRYLVPEAAWDDRNPSVFARTFLSDLPTPTLVVTP